MQLLQLTPAEIAYLTTPPAAADGFAARLTRRLAATLTARLRLPLQAKLMAPPPAAADVVVAAPVWQPDAALATVWLTRRLGGQRVAGAAPFVPASLIHSLDAALAETWLDGAVADALPAALAWHLTTGLAQATLAVRLPHSTIDMTRWARGAIRHG